MPNGPSGFSWLCTVSAKHIFRYPFDCLLLITSFLLLIASHSYATGNGIQHQEEGYNRKIGPELGEQIVNGGYSYTAPDGKLYSVQYKADAGGFQPIGDHLPTPPPLPQELQQ